MRLARSAPPWLLCLAPLALAVAAAPRAAADETPPAPAAAAAAPATPAAAPAAPAGGLRPLSGTVGLIERGAQPLPIYLDRLEAALFLEQAHGTVGPYVVSIANSLEALSPADRKGRGDRLLLSAYVMLAALSGPQAGRLHALYAAGLGQLLGLKPEETSVTQAIQRELRQIGAYASAAAMTRINALQDAAARAEALTHLRLAEGKYAEAGKHAQTWEARVPSPISRAFRLGAQLLAGQQAAARDLAALEREGGAAGQLSSTLLRRAAREALLARLGKALAGPSSLAVPAEVRKAATAWGKPEDPPLRDACQLLLKDKDRAQGTNAADCLVLLIEGPGTAWLDALPAAKLPASRRADMLELARSLGVILGVPGRRPVPLTETAVREGALQKVQALLPRAELPEEEAAAVSLMARIALTGKPEVPKDLLPAVSEYLDRHPCTPLALPLYLGRAGVGENGAAAREKELREALRRCEPGKDGRTDEALRLLALALAAQNGKDEAPRKVLERLAQGRGKVYGQGRFLLSLAEVETLSRIQPGGPQPTAETLAALERRYAEASAALVPWDGAEAKGYAEAQLATLLCRRHQLTRQAALLTEASAHLRFAQLLTLPDEAARIEALEVYVSRESQLQAGKPVAAPKLDAAKLPQGLGRRLLSCELLATARAAKDNAGAARYAALLGQGTLPEILTGGQPRLTTSLGVDERLRVVTRGENSVVVLPRCAAR
jgi:hypothetical protein